MTGSFVLDASVALAWVYAGQETSTSETALGALAGEGVAYVPTLWRYELASVLLHSERRTTLSPAQTEEFMEKLDHLPIYEEDAWPSALSMVRQGRIHGLTGYDAAYLILAQRLALPLATHDEALRGAAHEAKVALL